jgi:hypothetical protein
MVVLCPAQRINRCRKEMQRKANAIQKVFVLIDRQVYMQRNV